MASHLEHALVADFLRYGGPKFYSKSLKENDDMPIEKYHYSKSEHDNAQEAIKLARALANLAASWRPPLVVKNEAEEAFTAYLKSRSFHETAKRTSLADLFKTPVPALYEKAMKVARELVAYRRRIWGSVDFGRRIWGSVDFGRKDDPLEVAVVEFAEASERQANADRFYGNLQKAAIGNTKAPPPKSEAFADKANTGLDLARPGKDETVILVLDVRSPAFTSYFHGIRE